MAAVATSLVVFVTNLGFPELSLSSGRFSRAAEILFESGHDESESKQVSPCGSEAAAKDAQQGVGLAESQVRAECYQGKWCQGSLQHLRDDMLAPTFVKATAPCAHHSKGAQSMITSVTVDAEGVSAYGEDVRLHPAGQQRVRFDLSANTVHEITPYSEVYGMHPRDFHFGKSGAEVHTWRELACDSDEDEDEEDDHFADRIRRRVIRFRAPWPVWGVLVALVFMLSALGPEALPELFENATGPLRKSPALGAAGIEHLTSLR